MIRFIKRLLVVIPLVVLHQMFGAIGFSSWLFAGEFENKYTDFVADEIAQPIYEWANK